MGTQVQCGPVCQCKCSCLVTLNIPMESPTSDSDILQDVLEALNSPCNNRKEMKLVLMVLLSMVETRKTVALEEWDALFQEACDYQANAAPVLVAKDLPLDFRMANGRGIMHIAFKAMQTRPARLRRRLFEPEVEGGSHIFFGSHRVWISPGPPPQSARSVA